MSSPSNERPTAADAIEIVTILRGTAPESVQRFATGIGHWVYDVRCSDGGRLVVRMGMAEQLEDFLGAVHWSSVLRPVGVPLPALLDRGELRGLPYLVLERLDGEDLGTVYGSLTSPQRKAIAEEVCGVQRLVGALPEGRGYGFVRSPTGPYLSSWSDVIDRSLARSRRRIEAAGLVDPELVHRVEQHARRFRGYFARVRATPFLDDATTKNVLVHAGRFSGIVDVDWLCFGDPLFAVALTRTAILSSGGDPDYTDHWCALLDLSLEARRVVPYYTALFCVDFMSEFGRRFNQDAARLDPERLACLQGLLDDHLAEAEL